MMNSIECLGIDGTNPLGFLASMGALRVATLHDSNAKMRWNIDVAQPYPILDTTLSQDEFAQCCADEIKNVEKWLPKRDIISTDPDSFRRDFESVEKRLLQASQESVELSFMDYIAAFGSDGVCKTNSSAISVSDLSFSNGNSGQCLFKDYRAISANPSINADLIRMNILGHQKKYGKQISLNWDPGTLRSHALRWKKPADDAKEKKVDWAMDTLAFLGLAAFPAVPVDDKLQTTAIFKNSKLGDAFIWHLWKSDISYKVACSLLTSSKTHCGCVSYASRRINPDGKRYYFAPAVCLTAIHE